MKKSIVLVAAMALALVGCSASPESIAKKACIEEFESQISADKINYRDFNIGNMSDALFETGISSERDTSKDFMTGTGTVTSKSGTIEKKHSVLCMVTVADGKVTELSATVT